MRRLLAGLALFGVFAPLPLVQACSSDRAEANAPAATAISASTSAEAIPAGLARADFDVAGMDCGGCVIGTRAALRRLNGVQKADASYDDATDKGAAWAVYDPSKVTAERMLAAIRELGYTPTLVQAPS